MRAGGRVPDPVRAAQLAQAAGADGITLHLREDRRHIRDADVPAVQAAVDIPINLEMAATVEMSRIALSLKPEAICIVPERREERTTEGGLEVAGDEARLLEFIAPLRAAGSRVSLFVAPDEAQIEAAARVGAQVVELHQPALIASMSRLGIATRVTPNCAACSSARRLRTSWGLGSGHVRANGLNFDKSRPHWRGIPELVELKQSRSISFLIGKPYDHRSGRRFGREMAPH